MRIRHRSAPGDLSAASRKGFETYMMPLGLSIVKRVEYPTIE
jgi:hypothetical protein